MKNPAIEAMKQRAKLYHRNKVGDQFPSGIIVRHLYHDMTAETLSFWDDAVFIVDDYRVALWWTYPFAFCGAGWAIEGICAWY
jgi:hypothetical protein